MRLSLSHTHRTTTTTKRFIIINDKHSVIYLLVTLRAEQRQTSLVYLADEWMLLLPTATELARCIRTKRFDSFTQCDHSTRLRTSPAAHAMLAGQGNDSNRPLDVRPDVAADLQWRFNQSGVLQNLRQSRTVRSSNQTSVRTFFDSLGHNFPFGLVAKENRPVKSWWIIPSTAIHADRRFPSISKFIIGA